ncbi:uncharacterized protein LOC143922042 [Arctopsyche grandis]|uniref:uncharacterized protein LOC143922042 n=1 Tax=Arctopsyche grandis TaxID=121162 RepID=UPI00406D9204
MNQRVVSFAKVLKELDATNDNVFYYIKSLIIEVNLDEAQREMEKSNLNEDMKRYLKSLILIKKNELEKQQKEQQRKIYEQKKREERRRQEQYIGHETANKGKDFLGYYKILKVDRHVTPEALKKAHRKAVRVAGKKSIANSKLPGDKKDEETKKVNKAFHILSDADKKRAYDAGIDPESGPQQPSYRQQQYGFEEDDMQDILNSFFGSGRHQRGGSRFGRQQNSRFIFL